MPPPPPRQGLWPPSHAGGVGTCGQTWHSQHSQQARQLTGNCGCAEASQSANGGQGSPSFKRRHTGKRTTAVFILPPDCRKQTSTKGILLIPTSVTLSRGTVMHELRKLHENVKVLLRASTLPRVWACGIAPHPRHSRLQRHGQH